MFILIVVWGFLILLFVVEGVLIHSCDLRHGFIFFSVLFWCVSEVCVGIFGYCQLGCHGGRRKLGEIAVRQILKDC